MKYNNMTVSIVKFINWPVINMKSFGERGRIDSGRISIPISQFHNEKEYSLDKENSFSEIKSSLSSSVTSEWKANLLINDSIQFQNSFCFESPNKSEFDQETYYVNTITLLQKEIYLLSNKLQTSTQQIEKLKKKIETVSKENAIKIQFMQEQHEKKTQKTKQNLDFLLNDLNSRSNAILAERLFLQHAAEIERVKKNYEAIIEDLKYKCEHQISSIEAKKQKFCFNIKRDMLELFGEAEKQSRGDFVQLKIESLRGFIEKVKENEIYYNENERESYGEMSTLESEHDQEKNSITYFSAQKKCRSELVLNKKTRRYSLNIEKTQR